MKKPKQIIAGNFVIYLMGKNELAIRHYSGEGGVFSFEDFLQFYKSHDKKELLEIIERYYKEKF